MRTRSRSNLGQDWLYFGVSGNFAAGSLAGDLSRRRANLIKPWSSPDTILADLLVMEEKMKGNIQSSSRCREMVRMNQILALGGKGLAS